MTFVKWFLKAVLCLVFLGLAPLLSAAAQSQSGLPLGTGACLENATSATLVFSYHFGTDAPESVTLRPGQYYKMVRLYDTAGQSSELYINYDADFTPAYPVMNYYLAMSPTYDTRSCQGMTWYHFELSGSRVFVLKD
jgi:hypothetical protein